MKKFTVTVFCFIISFTAVILGCSSDSIDSAKKSDDIIDDNEIADIIDDDNSAVTPNDENPAFVPNEENIDALASGKAIQSLTTANIRAAASVNSTILGQLAKWQTLPLITQYNDNWYEIIYNGSRAYISAAYTKIYDPENASIKIENIIAAGEEALGTPYEFGAQRIYINGRLNPYFTGETFDCSSFVQYAYYVGAGIILDVTSRTQSVEGISVESISELKRGDLIFMWSSARQYNTGINQIGHVGIYYGDNKIMHTYGTGGVKIQEYTSGWKERFLLARRII